MAQLMRLHIFAQVAEELHIQNSEIRRAMKYRNSDLSAATTNKNAF